MVRGHVSTSDHDGRPLEIVFLVQNPLHQRAVLCELNAYVDVLRTFATKWNNNEKDINGVSPDPHCQPCSVLVVMMHHHTSTNTPGERIHITANPATTAQWNARETKGNMHVYSVGDHVPNGYDGYLNRNKRFRYFNTGTMEAAIAEAERNEYKQAAGR
ncbi:unnamed protein product [Clonostachys rosea]|uniref:Uncharacterized protein n=1 Tax=Bionectria ochroleuca TaxID=29856 RepID=A0ABY6USR4_BIOOC|nr:unnamed protein product [Clonostachys rosea]